MKRRFMPWKYPRDPRRCTTAILNDNPAYFDRLTARQARVNHQVNVERAYREALDDPTGQALTNLQFVAPGRKGQP